jgi:hypothetical protein
VPVVASHRHHKRDAAALGDQVLLRAEASPIAGRGARRFPPSTPAHEPCPPPPHRGRADPAHAAGPAEACAPRRTPRLGPVPQPPPTGKPGASEHLARKLPPRDTCPEYEHDPRQRRPIIHRQPTRIPTPPRRTRSQQRLHSLPQAVGNQPLDHEDSMLTLDQLRADTPIILKRVVKRLRQTGLSQISPTSRPPTVRTTPATTAQDHKRFADLDPVSEPWKGSS